VRVLVTGGAGYVGSVVARALLTHRHEVRVLDSLLYGGRALLGLYPEESFNFVRGDIRSGETVNHALQEIEAVIHLAAIVGDPACAKQPELAREVNLDASIQLFELCQRQGVKRFVFASTCSNYGKMIDSSKYATEESELCPVSLYAETKVAVEKRILDAAANHGMAVTVLRFATVFGLSPRMRFDLTVNEFTKELLTKRKLVVFGEQFWRPYIHVRDVARAMTHLLDAPPGKVAGQVFNVGGTEQNYTKKDLVEVIRREIRDDVEIEYVYKAEDPRDYRVSFEKIKSSLGFSTTRTVLHGVREVIDAIKQGVIVDLENSENRN